MGRFKSSRQAQQLLSALEPIRGHFHPHHHRLTTTEYRETMCQRVTDWRHSRDYPRSLRAALKECGFEGNGKSLAYTSPPTGMLPSKHTSFCHVHRPASGRREHISWLIAELD